MCDYSLMNFPNRLAADGEQLVVHRFPTGSLGLASPPDLKPAPRTNGLHRSLWNSLKDFFIAPNPCAVPAVCIPPGARLRLNHIPQGFCRQFKLEAEEEVRFEQLSAAPNTYRDAVVFGNGLKLRLQDLPIGQQVTVLSLTMSAAEEPVLLSEEPSRTY